MSRESKLQFTDSTIRMVIQSMMEFGAKPDDLSPILERMDDANLTSAEVWGGSSFDISMRYLKDDPWKRLRWIRKRVKKTPLQMLLRGQNLLGYKNYGHDVLEYFFEKAFENGIRRIRTFDALNDIRNLSSTIEVAKKVGIYVHPQLCFIKHPKITLDHYIRDAKKLEDMGADQVGLMDLNGSLDPQTATLLFLNFKRVLEIPCSIHARTPGGGSYLSVSAAIQAGVDSIDCALAPIALHVGMCSFEAVLSALSQDAYSVSPDAIHEMTHLAFPMVVKKRPGEKIDYLVDTTAVSHQMPTGVLKNVVNLLNQHGAIYRFKEVLDEIPRVVEEMGCPGMVTPTSQLVSTQAVYNVLLGERYKIVPKEVRYYFEGWYGAPPLSMNSDIVKKVLGEKKPLTDHVSTLLPNRMKKVWEELSTEWVERDEDYLSYALFPQSALRFFKWRIDPAKHSGPVEALPEKTPAELPSEEYSRILSIEKFSQFMEENDLVELLVEDGETSISINRSSQSTPAEPWGMAPATSRPPEPTTAVEPPTDEPGDDLDPIESPMVGVFYASASPELPPFVTVGKRIQCGDVLCLVEAMKLFNEIKSEISGVVRKILVKNEDVVQNGQTLFLVEKE